MTTPTPKTDKLQKRMPVGTIWLLHAQELERDLAAREAELAAMKQGKILADGMANMIRGFILKTVERETLDEAAAKYRKWEEDYCHSTPAKIDRDLAARDAELAEAMRERNDAIKASLDDMGKSQRAEQRAEAAERELAAMKAENSKLRSALEIVHFKREPWQ